MNTQITKMMKYFVIYCLAVLPLVLYVCSDSSVPALDKALQITDCQDCIKFPRNSSSYSGFSVIVIKNNTPTLLVGARDGVLEMTMDGRVIHYTSIPSNNAYRKACLQNLKMGTVDEYGCDNVITGIFPQKKTGLIFACGSNSGRSPQCWKANATSVTGSPNTEAFYTIPERKHLISDPYVYQGYTFPDNKLNGELLRVDIYSNVGPRGSTYTLRLEDDAPRFVNLYEFDNYIYYFFTDKSEEKIKDGSRVTYARVGRLCKFDSGGSRGGPAPYHFNTFSKARLLCPVTTDGQVFQFNNLELTSVITADDGNVYVYGLFRAAKPADNMFAICRYSLSEIEKAFTNKNYYVRDDKTIKTVAVGDNDLRHQTCNEFLDTTKASYQWFSRVYKKRLLHVSVVTPDTGKPVMIREHGKISNMLAENVMIASTSYDLVRLFDSNFMYELFIPVNSFQEESAKTFLSTRKISEESLTIKDVAKIKYDGDGTPVDSSTASPETASTTESKLGVSTTAKPLPSTQRPTTTNSSSTPTKQNLTRNNQTKTSNVSTTNPNHTTDHTPVTATDLSGMSVTTPNPETKLRQSKATTPSPSSAISWDSFIGQVKIIVAAFERLVFVPLASCGAHTTCRGCVAIKNPYCAWQNGKCVQLNASGNGVYIQNKESGDYSKVCPPVDVTCNVQVSKMIPKAEFTLQCHSSGLPDPRVTFWSKNGKRLTDSDSKELKIQSYTLETVGKYTCHVSNNVTSDNCSVEIRGSKPKIDCTVTRFVLSFNVSGYPRPEVVLKKKTLRAGKTRVKAPMNVVIEKHIEYEFMAFNAFGSDDGGVYKLISKVLEFMIKGEKWSDQLANPGSQQYKQLKDRVMKAIVELYKDNRVFMSANVTFREGSVIAAVEITGLKTPTSDESVLTDPLEEAIKKKTLGDLVISEPDEAPDPVAQEKESSSGVPVWLLILLLILIGLIVFFVGYFCGFRRHNCRTLFGSTGLCRKNSSEDDVEMKGMSRNEKARESERMLLRKDEGKKQSPSKRKSPQKRNHEPLNHVSKHGSVEIKQNYGSEEDCRAPAL